MEDRSRVRDGLDDHNHEAVAVPEEIAVGIQLPVGHDPGKQVSPGVQVQLLRGGIQVQAGDEQLRAALEGAQQQGVERNHEEDGEDTEEDPEGDPASKIFVLAPKVDGSGAHAFSPLLPMVPVTHSWIRVMIRLPTSSTRPTAEAKPNLSTFSKP